MHSREPRVPGLGQAGAGPRAVSAPLCLLTLRFHKAFSSPAYFPQRRKEKACSTNTGTFYAFLPSLPRGIFIYSGPENPFLLILYSPKISTKS